MDDAGKEIIVGAYPLTRSGRTDYSVQERDGTEKIYIIELLLHLLNNYLSSK